MAKFSGVIQKSDLEGGFFQLVTDGGETYRLEGKVEVSEGAKVAVHGELQTGGFGIHMSGPSIQVQKIDAL